jgi:glycosyltransferase involved in cell wall biosynthesis
MKIAIVANSTWNIYNFRLNILRALEEKGAEIVVIAPIDKYIFYLNEFKNVRHIPLKRLSRKSTNPLRDVLLFNEFYRIYQREKFDVVLHYTIKPNIWGNLAARFCKTPSVCAVTGLGYAFLHNGWVEKLSTFLYRFSFKSAKKVIFENIDDRLLFIEKKIITAQQGISVKGCGINIEHFVPQEADKKPKGKTIFTFIGRLLYDKGIHEFVEAARIIKKTHQNVEFWVVGGIDEDNPATVSEETLLQWVNEKIIIEKGTSDDVRREIRNSDCIVFPSYREAIAKVLQEAMAMEKPVITTDVAGCREAVDVGENGFLVQVKNAESIAFFIEKFLELPDNERLAMGKKGREKVVREFDERDIAKQIIHFLNQLVQ